MKEEHIVQTHISSPQISHCSLRATALSGGGVRCAPVQPLPRLLPVALPPLLLPHKFPAVSLAQCGAPVWIEEL